MQIASLSDEELVSGLRAICAENHRLVARLVVHLGEVEERRLHLKAASSSMFDFCVRRLGMSEGAAHRRINAARLVRRFPRLIGPLERGELHLSSLVLLARHLTDANADELIAAATGRSLREVEDLLARYAPKPDVPDRIWPIASPPTQASFTMAGPTAVSSRPPATRIEPLSEKRFKVQLTASRELRDKLERARDRMRHANPTGDLSHIVERALDLLLEKLDKERLGQTTRTGRGAPRREGRKPDRSNGGRIAITRPIRREVFARDGEQCTFHDESGHRCPARTLLELDHVEPQALGGPDEVSNLRVRCRLHNRLHAENVFGKENVARAIASRRRKLPADDQTKEHNQHLLPPSPFEQAMRGLENMGFTKSDAHRALGAIWRGYEHGVDAIPIADLLRAAIAALT